MRRRAGELSTGARGLLAVITLALAGAAIAAFVSAPAGEAPPDAAGRLAVSLEDASRGGLRLVNSRRGHAIVSDGRSVPGARARGTVRIGNRGDEPLRLWLIRRGLRSPPNSHGERLAPRLKLTVKRLGPSPSVIHRGSVATLGQARAGRLRPGASHRYRFAVRFADGGVPAGPTSGDNLLQGARANVNFVWGASRVRP